MKRSIQIFNFLDGSKRIVASLQEASNITGIKVNVIKKQLLSPAQRVHELRQMMEGNCMNEITKSVITKTYKYEFNYFKNFEIRLHKLNVNTDLTFSLSTTTVDFNNKTDVAEFLGVSRQTIYNRKCNPNVNVNPIRSQLDGEYYLIEFSDMPIDVSLFGKNATDLPSMYLVRVYTEDLKALTKVTNNAKDLYQFIKVNSPIMLTMPYDEFFGILNLLTSLPDDLYEKYNDDDLSFCMKPAINPKSTTYGIAVTYDALGVDFTKGSIIIKLR